MTKTKITKIVKALKKEQYKISKSRAILLDLIRELEAIDADCEASVALLQDAIDSLLRTK